VSTKRGQITREDHLPERSLGDLVGYHLRRASVFDLQGSTAALEEAGLRPVSMSVLSTIIEKSGITAAEICRVLGMQRANIVSVLADLEEKGFFLRDADENDQRIQRLYPTEAGRDITEKSLALLTAHEERLLQRLDGDERRELLRLLAMIWQPSSN
jgi:DNA-binding MarR family transcriptional regulator